MKLARHKLANFKKLYSLARYNEEFLKIIHDIPGISQDEALDRYKGVLKQMISKDLCIREYSDLNRLMSDAANVDASQASFKRNTQATSFPSNQPSINLTPMDIGNTQAVWKDQKLVDYQNGLCFGCHKKGFRWST